jgi:hypothetical protein
MMNKTLSLASPRAKRAMLAEINVMPNPKYANSFALNVTLGINGLSRRSDQFAAKRYD